MSEKMDMKINFFQKGSPDWIILVACIIVGALVGFAFSYVKTPIYEATASVTANLQLSKGGPVTEFMLDSQINHIGELYYNPHVVQELIASEAKNANEIDLSWLKSNASIERRMLNTLVKVQHADPEIAARIASEWATILYETLQEVYPTAVEVSAAKNTLALLDHCINPKETVEIDAFCKSITKSEYDSALEKAQDILAELGDKTLGLSEYLSLTHHQAAPVPSKPISYHRGSMTLAGSALGFVATFVYFLIRKQDD